MYIIVLEPVTNSIVNIRERYILRPTKSRQKEGNFLKLPKVMLQTILAVTFSRMSLRSLIE